MPFSAAWALPFVGLMLSFALLPMLAPRHWHEHVGKLTLGWALAFLLPFGLQFGFTSVGEALVHAALGEYLPFIVLLTTLYTVAGGIHLRGRFRGGAGFNTALMAVGAALASVMGTTGASMLLIRPLILANENRPHQAHVVVFFIFIVANTGGALTPLGDPPLLVGYLKGVDFFWTARHIWQPTLFLLCALLAVFYAIDAWVARRDGAAPPAGPPAPGMQSVGLDGSINVALLGVVIALVLLSGTWRPGIEFVVAGTRIGAAQIVRDALLVGVTLLSLRLTPRAVYERNRFGWGPMAEVATLFAGLFVTIVPVLAMLAAGAAGPFAPVVSLIHTSDGQPVPMLYFWATGLLSSFLDNAPTYLAFFTLAGADAQRLMTDLAPVLAAISAGAVFMGAVTYVGNAPNLMIKTIAEDRGVRMPSFFGYMLWSGAVLLPLFVAVTWIWFP